MSISDTIWRAELEIEEYLALGWYGDPTDPVRQVIEHSLIHSKAVRWLLDQYPPSPDFDDQLTRLRTAAIAGSFGTSSEFARQAFQPQQRRYRRLSRNAMN